MLFLRLPSAFLPAEDQGTLIAQVKAPVGATQQRTMQSIAKLEQHFRQNETDTVEVVIAMQGFSFGGTGQNTGTAFVKLKDWDERKRPEFHVDAIAGRAMANFDSRSRTPWHSLFRHLPFRNWASRLGSIFS